MQNKLNIYINMRIELLYDKLSFKYVYWSLVKTFWWRRVVPSKALSSVLVFIFIIWSLMNVIFCVPVTTDDVVLCSTVCVTLYLDCQSGGVNIIQLIVNLLDKYTYSSNVMNL